jgi:hypothetical protein
MPRNSGGTYTLPAGNPVVTATTITSTWANTTLSDLANEITDSLSRNGEGGMLAALELVDGAVATPSLTFTSEPTSGFALDNPAELTASILGLERQRWTNTGTTITGTFGVTGAFDLVGDLEITGGLTVLGDVAATGEFFASDGTVLLPSYSFGDDPNTGFWSPGADLLAASVAGAEVFRLGAAGILQPLGLVGTPSYSFSGDPNTGMWSSAADILNFSTAGVERMRVTANSVRLHGSASSNGLLTILDGTASGLNANTSCDALVIDSDANSGMTIFCGTGGTSQIQFGDPGANARGGLAYVEATPEVRIFGAAGVSVMVRHADVATSFPIGFRNLPTLANTATAQALAVGKVYLNTAAITINNSVFTAGDIVMVYNNSAAAFNITQGTITTMRLAGTATTGTRSLAARGMASLFFPTATECVVGGDVT